MCVTLTLILRLFLGGAGGFTQLTWINHTASWLAETEKTILKTLLLKWLYLDAFTLKRPERMTFIVLNIAVFAIKPNLWSHKLVSTSKKA